MEVGCVVVFVDRPVLVESLEQMGRYVVVSLLLRAQREGRRLDGLVVHCSERVWRALLERWPLIYGARTKLLVEEGFLARVFGCPMTVVPSTREAHAELREEMRRRKAMPLQGQWIGVEVYG